MDLILWRHAKRKPGEPDLGRRLTSKGLKQAERMAAVARRAPAGHLPHPGVAGRPRAADRACAASASSRRCPSWRPGATVSAVLAAANWPDSREPVLIVGHQPTLGDVASFLLSGEEAYWSVRKGAVWWLSNRATRGRRGGRAARSCIGPDFV